MSEPFDPYRVWLGIPRESRAPTYYELLGISPTESEAAVIKAAATRQSAYVRNFQMGMHAKDATRILNEIGAAKACLQDADKRRRYDAELHASQADDANPTFRATTPRPLERVAPAVDLDQLIAVTMPAPASTLGGVLRRSPPRLARPRAKGFRLQWQMLVGVGVALSVALAASAMWPKRAEEPSAKADESLLVAGSQHTESAAAAPLEGVLPPQPKDSASLPPELTSSDDILFADFEGEDYDGWQTSGTAFGASPVKGTLLYQASITGFMGAGLVNSFVDQDKATGKLASPKFKIERKYIGFLIGGGWWEGQTCVNLVVDGVVVRSATARNGTGATQRLERLAPAGWNTTDLMGKTVHIEIIDDSTELWGHINVDHIVFTNHEPAVY